MSLQEHLTAVLQKHIRCISEFDGVTGAGVGFDLTTSSLSIVIYTNNLPAESKDAILKTLAGEPVSFEETGPISPRTSGSPEGCAGMTD